MTCLSHKTAISRKIASAPMRGLNSKDRLTGRMLDYGCGRGRDAIEFDMSAYDPHYSPDMPDGLFDTITCNFVLNTIESNKQRCMILTDIWSRLSPDGKAYLTVRTDKKALVGTTSKGTWQGLVVMNLPIASRGSGYVTYELARSVCLSQVSMKVETFEAA